MTLIRQEGQVFMRATRILLRLRNLFVKTIHSILIKIFFYSLEYLSTPSSPFFNLKPDVFFAKNQKSSNTVVYPGTVIARAFQKPAVSDGFISKVLLANANAFCATALPGNEDEQNKL